MQSAVPRTRRRTCQVRMPYGEMGTRRRCAPAGKYGFPWHWGQASLCSAAAVAGGCVAMVDHTSVLPVQYIYDAGPALAQPSASRPREAAANRQAQRRSTVDLEKPLNRI